LKELGAFPFIHGPKNANHDVQANNARKILNDYTNYAVFDSNVIRFPQLCTRTVILSRQKYTMVQLLQLSLTRHHQCSRAHLRDGEVNQDIYQKATP
jgi:hypothetical protein